MNDAYRPEELSIDSFLGGKLSLAQPLHGYRAAIDPILLAACVPAHAGEHILEPGIGTGAAALALLARVPDIRITGVEREGAVAQLARDNAARNGFDAALEVIEADLATPRLLAQRNYHHVMMNPPYHDHTRHRPPHQGGIKGRATHGDDSLLALWLGFGARRLLTGGSLSIIHRADAIADILKAMPASMGAIRLLPVAPHRHAPAMRLVVQAIKGRKTPPALLPPLVLHDEIGGFSNQIDDILRGLTGISI